MPVVNPFPLNIPTKQNSWEKEQMLKFADLSLFYNAAEFNKITQGLEWLYENGSASALSGNVPAKFRNVSIDHTTNDPIDIVKMKNAINAGSNYPLDDLGFYFFINHRLVLTNGSYGFPRPDGLYAVITDYYVLTTKIPIVDGTASVGIGGTEIDTSDLKFLFSLDNRSYEPTQFELGDIVAVEVWDFVKVNGPYATPNGAVIIFNATQNAEEESWIYVGNEEEIGFEKYQPVEDDFKPFAEGDLPPSYQETLPTQGWSGFIPTIPMNNHETARMFMNAASGLNSYTTSDHVLGGERRILIHTTGKTEFPDVIAGIGTATLIKGDAFEADETYDLFIECNYIDKAVPDNDIINYFFIMR